MSQLELFNPGICPGCGWSGPLLGDYPILAPLGGHKPPESAQVAGCCEGFIMCPACATEFDWATGAEHNSATCEECAAGHC